MQATPMNEIAQAFLTRLELLEPRLRGLAGMELGGLTAAEPGTGEQWDCGQVWAHMAEFIPYWITQAEKIVSRQSPEPWPFGRTKTDPDRIAAIEKYRREPVRELWRDISEDINDLRSFINSAAPDAWELAGLHPTLGVMPLPKIVDEFLVGHLEQHAAQLESLGA